MYNIFLLSHSYIRYFILILLVVIIVKSLLGWTGKKPFTKLDDKIGLYLVIFTHLQLVAGIVLYFLSPRVVFGSETMSNSDYRYWTVEHVFAMLIAVALITIARSTSKRMPDDLNRFKRLFILNIVALIVIVSTILMSGDRGVV